MTFHEFFLILAALCPAIVLCVYTFQKDRVEKEPLDFLLLLFGLGVLSVVPTAGLEGPMLDAIKQLFSKYTIVLDDGAIALSKRIFYIYNFLKYFIGVALVEEGIKYLILICTTRHSKHFNCLFDGLIYAVFISLGFAASENVNYVLHYGWFNAIQRAILSVPGHMFFSVLMGFYYSEWKIIEKAKVLEKSLKQEGHISADSKEFSSSKARVLSLLMPVLAHGFYDYCCTLQSSVAMIVFYLFVCFLYWYCFGRIRLMSAADSTNLTYARILIQKKYPSLYQ